MDVATNAITGTANNVASSQLAAGQARAQGIEGVAGANVDMVNGIANSINSSLGLYLGHKQWQQFASILNNRNNPTGGSKDPVFDSTDTVGGPYNYLRPGT